MNPDENDRLDNLAVQVGKLTTLLMGNGSGISIVDSFRDLRGEMAFVKDHTARTDRALSQVKSDLTTFREETKRDIGIIKAELRTYQEQRSGGSQTIKDATVVVSLAVTVIAAIAALVTQNPAFLTVIGGG